MAAAISNWYHSSLWSRSRQIQVAPLLAQAEENARLGRPPAEAVVINMGEILADDPALLNAIKPKKHETLFGPSLGAINPGPAWTSYGKQEPVKDELTQETVKAWIAKSKEPSQPTTTLQALVNLKRPSIRLSPLVQHDGPEDAPSTYHGLEFEYDLDAARGRILLEVISPNRDTPPILIYDATVDGGFNKQLKVEDGAAFELAKLENHKDTAPPVLPTPDSNATATPSAAEPAANVASTQQGPSTKKRFSAFNFRKKTRTAGPAVPVVDAQTTVAPPEPEAQTETQTPKPNEANPEEDTDGVRVRIRIEALDENDKTLVSPNAQTTYLHIVRVGSPPAAPEEGAQPEEDTRPWVVKVVKREATIGLHTFHLHEIYGLATGSNSSGNAAPAPSHTYPPNAGEDEEAHAQAYDFAGTECVLCLSEPREVVLLPCRHLVACKDCAMNMIEFGAGGTVVQNTEEAAPAVPSANATPGADAAGNANNTDQEAGNAAVPAPAVVPPVAPRRKRKAKGWFCPVCRQPYTSMLRITTTPPEAKKLTSPSGTELAPNANIAEPPPAVIAGAPPNLGPDGTGVTNKLGSLTIGGNTNENGMNAGEPSSSTAAPNHLATDPLGAETARNA